MRCCSPTSSGCARVPDRDGAQAPGGDGHVSSFAELAFFVALLPGWVFLAKLYGLYERDEERTDHSTVDDVVGVFHLVTVGVWLFYIAVIATALATPPIQRLITFWFLAVALVTVGRALARARAGAASRTSRTRSSSAPATSGS